MKSNETYGGLHVLVVEDNENMQRLLREMLRTFGVGVVDAVSNGPAAIRHIAAELPDVVLVDWALPGMSGIELARHIRLSDESINPYLPIIMVTGHADQRRIAEARNAGVHEFVAKPVSPLSLAKHLAEVVERPRPFVRTSNYFGPDRRRRDVKRRLPERRSEAVHMISPEEIQAYVEVLREKMTEGPVERVKAASGAPGVEVKVKSTAEIS